MNITYCDNYGSMSQLAGSKVIRELQHHEEPLLCAASGQSPTGLYQYLVKESKEGTHPLPALKVIKLDEWVGLPENHPATCEYYLRETLLKPLKIPDSRYISFDSNATDPMEECNRIQQELERSGPINVCIAGLGTNGHVGLIEPDQSLEPSCHIADLTPATLHHQMLQSAGVKPTHGFTLGMQDILSSRMIGLLVTGKDKKPILRRLLTGEVSSLLPASYLWTHHNVECIIDRKGL